MRRLAIAAALLVVPVVPSSAAPKVETVVYVFDRLRPRAALLYVSAVVETGGDYALAASATAVVGRDGRYYNVTGLVFGGATSSRKSLVGPTSGLPQCGVKPHSTLCEEQTGGYGGYFAGDQLYNRVFLILHGQIKSVGFSVPPGWRSWRWKGPVRLVSSADTLTVHAMHQYRFGQFDGRVTAPGGAHGSIALGHPPCAADVGLGDVRLRGGVVDVDASCLRPPPARHVPPPASYAEGKTTWTLEGTATGWSDVATRLVVMDLP